MAGRDMTLSVILRLRDEMGRGIDAVMGKLNRLSAFTKKISAGMATAIGGIATKLSGLGIGAGVGLMAGLESLTKYDAGLRDIAITAGLTGKAVEDFVKTSGAKLQDLAKQTGQVSSKLMESHQIMTAAGIETPAAQAMLPSVGKTSTAAGADAADITKTAIAAFQNSEIKPDQLGTALSHMVTGGKLGSFELKDMSQHFPTVLAALANLGVKGMGGVDTATAMLQISKRTAGTTGEAATNFQDFLSGINSDHTRKRFAKHGVDLPAVMADAQARGINPVEAVIQKVAKIINQPKVVDEAMKRAQKKGLDPTKTQEEVRKAVDQAVKAAGMGELFVNQQSKMFLMAMLANLGDYKKFKEQIGKADPTVIDEDFNSRMNGPEAKQRMASEKVEQLMRRLGEALTSAYDKVGAFADALTSAVKALDSWSPKIVDIGVQLGAMAAGLGAVVFALRMLGFGGAAAAGAGVGAGVTAGAGGGVAAKVATAASGGGLLSFLGAGAAAALGAGAADGGIFYVLSHLGGDFGRGPKKTHKRGWIDEISDWLSSDPEPAKGSRQHAAWMQRQKPRAPSNIDTSFKTITNTEKGPLDVLGWYGSKFFKYLATPTPPSMPDGRSSSPRTTPATPPQKVEVGGAITIKVDGPGQVTSATSKTPGVTIGADRGSNGGRP